MYKTTLAAITLVWTVSQVSAQIYKCPSKPTEITIANYGLRTFFLTRTAGSLALVGAGVTDQEGDVVKTDEITVLAPSCFQSIDAALDNLTQAYPHISWLRGNDSLVRVRDDRASQSILALRLEKIELKDVVSLTDGVDKLLSSPEVQSYAHRKGIDLSVVHSSGYFANEQFSRQLAKNPATPRYSRTLMNASLEEALDIIVGVFPGVWVYEECPSRIRISAVDTGLPDWKKIAPEFKK